MSGKARQRPVAHSLNHYQILGVKDFASSEEVKDAFRKLAREMHPDVQHEVDEATKAANEARFKRVVEAYSTLKDDTSRRLYDSTLFGTGNTMYSSSSGDPFQGYYDTRRSSAAYAATKAAKRPGTSTPQALRVLMAIAIGVPVISYVVSLSTTVDAMWDRINRHKQADFGPKLDSPKAAETAPRLRRRERDTVPGAARRTSGLGKGSSNE